MAPRRLPRRLPAAALPLAFILLLAAVFPPAPAAAQADERIRVMSDLQVWADANRNGFLEPIEIDRLMIATIELLLGPHPGRSPLDGMFDLNGDGRIDPDEITESMNVVCARLGQADSEFAATAARRLLKKESW